MAKESVVDQLKRIREDREKLELQEDALKETRKKELLTVIEGAVTELSELGFTQYRLSEGSEKAPTTTGKRKGRAPGTPVSEETKKKISAGHQRRKAERLAAAAS